MRPALLCCWLLVCAISSPAMAVDQWGVVASIDGAKVVIQLPGHNPAPAAGDMVEITTTAFGEELVIGEWRVETVRDDGAVVATPVDVLADPEPGMRTVIHTTEE